MHVTRRFFVTAGCKKPLWPWSWSYQISNRQEIKDQPRVFGGFTFTIFTYQDSSGSGLTGNELARPIFGLGHKVAILAAAGPVGVLPLQPQLLRLLLLPPQLLYGELVLLFVAAYRGCNYIN